MTDKFSYEAIAPLIAEQQVSGRNASFLFRCPMSGAEVRASIHVRPSDSTVGKAASQMGRSMSWEVQRTVSSLLTSVFGYGAVGRMASQAVGSVVQGAVDAASSDGLSGSEAKAAAVDAFKSIAGQFAWDPKGGRWLSGAHAQETLSAFEQQLAEGPVDKPYDKQVLARMLVEIAAADGEIAAQEESALEELLGGQAGSLAALRSKPKLTKAELGQVGQKAKSTLYTLAAVVAMSDEEFGEAERKKLGEWAPWLGMMEAEAHRYRRNAQQYLIDQAMERMLAWGGHDEHARSELYAMGGRIGMSQDEVEAAEADYLRRKA